MSKSTEGETNVRRELKRATRGQPKIYPCKQGNYRWYVSWRHKGKRDRYFYRTKPEAEEKKKKLIATIQHEGAEGVHFGAVARAEYAAAMKILRPHGASLIEAAQSFAKSKDKSAGKDWSTAVFDLLESLERANRRAATIQNTKSRLAYFEAWAAINTLEDFTRETCEIFLSSGDWKPSTVASYRAALSKLGNHCHRRGWMAENPAANIAPPTLDRGNPIVYTIQEANRLLTVAATLKNGAILARLSLLLLCGLRPTEIDSLSPSDFRPDGVRVGTGKKRGRRSVRFVRASDAFRAWWEISDKNLTPPNFRKIYEASRGIAGVAKRGTKLERHTWISAKLAVSEDENATAREAGNSPEVIYNDYFQLIDRDEAGRLGAYSDLDARQEALTLKSINSCSNG
jgi:site-specific recombinase XerC